MFVYAEQIQYKKKITKVSKTEKGNRKSVLDSVTMGEHLKENQIKVLELEKQLNICLNLSVQ